MKSARVVSLSKSCQSWGRKDGFHCRSTMTAHQLAAFQALSWLQKFRIFRSTVQILDDGSGLVRLDYPQSIRIMQRFGFVLEVLGWFPSYHIYLCEVSLSRRNLNMDGCGFSAVVYSKTGIIQNCRWLWMFNGVNRILWMILELDGRFDGVLDFR